MLRIYLGVSAARLSVPIISQFELGRDMYFLTTLRVLDCSPSSLSALADFLWPSPAGKRQREYVGE